MKHRTVTIGPYTYAVTPSGSVYRVTPKGSWICATRREVEVVAMKLGAGRKVAA